MFCMSCGAKNPDGARFCAGCGVGLSDPGAKRVGDAPRWERKEVTFPTNIECDPPDLLPNTIERVWAEHEPPFARDGWEYDGDISDIGMETMWAARLRGREIGVFRKRFVLDQVTFPLRRRLP